MNLVAFADKRYPVVENVVVTANNDLTFVLEHLSLFGFSLFQLISNNTFLIESSNPASGCASFTDLIIFGNRIVLFEFG